MVIGPVEDVPHGARAAAAGATMEELGDGLVRGAPEALDPLPSISESAVFEEVASGDQPAPVAFLACLGPLSDHGPRAAFASDLLRAGGFAAAQSEPAQSPAALADAFKASGASVTCICGTDADYEALAEPVCAALRAAGARSIVIARRAADGDEALRAAGLSGHVYLGCDAAAILGELRSMAATSSSKEAH